MQERMTAAQFRKRKSKRSKYGNKKTIVDGITFDSKAEARFYSELKLRKQAGEIKDFVLQPRYILQDGFVKNGKTFRKIEYVADFEIHHNDGTTEVVDVKGAITKEFSLKRKMFEFKYLESLKVLKYDSRYGFVDIDELDRFKKARKG
ncbi:DUF1064 domain-containing protein [Heyndrickxia ginsengihumi]|uniref:DUF1064 domain-containing protein n=1 Tax=Heyndrickxia ginsengihumi TaxID=363870 RepID=UPI000B295DED|nr:DUF1064 domain-containing protein [Heyndrickxia ginsengihumi]